MSRPVQPHGFLLGTLGLSFTSAWNPRAEPRSLGKNTMSLNTAFTGR